MISFSVWNVYDNVINIMGHKMQKWYHCPIIGAAFSVWNVCESVINIISHFIVI